MTDTRTTSPESFKPSGSEHAVAFRRSGASVYITRRYVPGRWQPHPHRRPSHDPDIAALVRGVHAHRDRILDTDPWVAFPLSTDCSYTFGTDKRRLPVGALITLWERWDAMSGDCPECGAQVLGISVGGQLSVGGIRGACLRCSRSTLRMVGGAARVLHFIEACLGDTPYTPHMAYLGAGLARPRALVELLRSLGAEDLPPEEWVRRWDGDRPRDADGMASGS